MFHVHGFIDGPAQARSFMIRSSDFSAVFYRVVVAKKPTKKIRGVGKVVPTKSIAVLTPGGWGILLRIFGGGVRVGFTNPDFISGQTVIFCYPFSEHWLLGLESQNTEGRLILTAEVMEISNKG